MVIDPSTSAGLAELAATEGARLILFGSDYRTPPGRVEPGGAAQGLLEGSPVAIGVAAAGLRTRADETIQTISVAGEPTAPPTQSADALAQALGAEVLAGGGDADLILVDSQSNGPEGRIALGGSTRASWTRRAGQSSCCPAAPRSRSERRARRPYDVVVSDRRAPAPAPVSR